MYISFLGLGQAGGNLADLAMKRGFYSAAINFSQRDLDSLEEVELKLKLVGSEGIGKQREHAIQLMNNNWDLATNFVKENFSHSSIEIVFIPFATGGGSGGGIAPILLQLLTESMPDKIFVAMPIIPDIKETYTSQHNCLEVFEDLAQLDICTLPIDNEKARATLNNVGKNNLYKTVNENVINLIEKLVSYTDKHSKYGILDKKDLKTIFSVKGVSTISETSIVTLQESIEISDSAIADKVIQSWSKSCFADIEFNQILSSGFIFDGQESLMEFINMEKIFANFDNKMPISLFESYYNENKGSILTVLSGLAWSNKRLEQIDQIITNTTNTFNNLSQTEIYKSKANIQSKINNITHAKKQTKINDISSIINKFKR